MANAVVSPAEISHCLRNCQCSRPAAFAVLNFGHTRAPPLSYANTVVKLCWMRISTSSSCEPTHVL